MPVDQDSVAAMLRAAVAPCSSAVDETLLSYLSMMVTDALKGGASTCQDLEEVAGSTLEASGLTEQERSDAVRRLYAELVRAGEIGAPRNDDESSQSAACEEKESTPPLLVAPVTISDEPPTQTKEPTRTGVPKPKRRLRRKRRSKKPSDKAEAGLAMTEEERQARLRTAQSAEEHVHDEPIPRKVDRPPDCTLDVILQGIQVTTANGDVLLAAADLRFIRGHRYGLIGRNGVGKTTLLRRLQRRSIPGFPPYLSCLHVRQEVEATHFTPLEVVLASDVERSELLQEEDRLLRELETLEASSSNTELAAQTNARLSEIYERLDGIESHSAEQRATSVLEGLQFTPRQLNSPVEELSGGWRMRVSLACALFMEPDLLMLDEPCNHLDLRGVLFLQDFLKSYKGTVIVVSHDRGFLDAAVTDIVLFRKKSLQYYPGNFSAFIEQQTKKRQSMMQAQATLDKQRKHMEDTVKRIENAARKGGDQKKLGQVASRRKKLERHGLDRNPDGSRYRRSYQGPRWGSKESASTGWLWAHRTVLVDPGDPSFRFLLPEPANLGVYGPVLEVKDVSFTYPPPASGVSNAPVLKNWCMSLSTTSRVTILGANGAGKSTLMNLLAGQLQPTSGSIVCHHNLQIAHFTQHHVQQLQLSHSPLEHMLETFPGSKPHDMRSQLGRFGIGGQLAVQPMATLSGGQKSRVVFATITHKRPQLLLLDEPTNHLDYDTIEATLEALKEYKGGVVVITHDQRFIEQLAQELWVVSNGTASRFDGSFQEYSQGVVREMRRPRPPSS